VRHAGRATSAAFLFEGHGSQYEGMGEELFEAHPVFRDALRQCDAVLADEFGPRLLDILYGPPETRSLVHRVEYGNGIFFSLEWALARLWMSRGVRPAYVIGHSVGEYAAACVAGVFGMEDGLRLVTRLGKLQQSLAPGGGMLAVGASRESVESVLAGSSDACVAAVNGPASVVVAAERGAIDRLRATFEAGGVRTSVLKVAVAFHSPQMNPILDDLHALARSVELSPPEIPYISCLTGTRVSDELREGSYWVRHLARPIRFLDGMRTLLAEEPTHFINIGPASTLLRMGRQCATHRQRRSAKWIPSIGPDGSDGVSAADSATVNVEGEHAAPSSAEAEKTVRTGTVAVVRECVARLARVPEDEVRLHRPISDHGMDSLMAAEFVEAVERETGARLPANLMTADLTVAKASAWVDARLPGHRHEASPDPDAKLVPFRTGGARVPLHFIPAGEGDLFGFRQVVARLSDDQPVYGLQPPRSRDVPGSRGAPIRWLVDMYVDAIEKGQPNGPYRLAGYSAAGIIAVEIAREFMHRGKVVEFVLLLDSAPHVPLWFGMLYEGLCRFCNLVRLPRLALRLNSPWLRRLLHAVMDEGLRAHARIIRNHDVAPFPGRLIHFRARSSWIRRLELATPGKAWRRIARGGFEVRIMDGTHHGMFRGPHQEDFAGALDECLASGDP